MKLALSSSPHQKAKRKTSRVMALVMAACVPGLLLQTFFFGWGAIIHFALAGITAVATEALILEWRKRDFERAIRDNSALLTAMLLALSIPPMAPWWISVLGTFFAIAIVKQLYGGLGYNVFNPAMAAYVMLLISFPVEMTNWIPATSLAQFDHGLLDAVWMIFTGFTTEGYSVAQLRTGIDGVTLATPLDYTKTALTQGQTLYEVFQHQIFMGVLGHGWFWVNLAYLAGGLYLIKAKLINWHIPGGMLLSILVISTFMYLVDGDRYAPPLFHLFNGGIMLGAFFIATDPVSASTTDRGRLIFGAGIGLWVYLIRTFGGYPDAIAFSVLVMNMAVPLIDYYTQPRTYGHRSEHKKSIAAGFDKDSAK